LSHCSVLYSTIKGRYVQVHYLTDLKTPPLDLFIKCRFIAVNKQEYDLNKDISTAYFIKNKKAIQSTIEKGLMNYIGYPRPGQIWYPVAIPTDFPELKIPYPKSKHLVAVWMFLKKLPPYFQMIHADCQSFAKRLMEQFTTARDPRVNEAYLTGLCLKLYHGDNVGSVRYPEIPDDYAKEEDFNAITVLVSKAMETGIHVLLHRAEKYEIEIEIDSETEPETEVSDGEEVAAAYYPSDVEDDDYFIPFRRHRRSSSSLVIFPGLLSSPEDSENSDGMEEGV